ncbi:carbonic anhydrase [Nesterenkonia alkaliphila]|uniref:carbonic anhydrase n=1 Tax=Nesterenkonia alkaliphila TaxID=1463631 RepID=A0A7K1UEB7_9MICC|nr:carbonic anhydrase [Nesterenkonia alkaliphila]MVT24825.1 carbonic anhydrase [Nesterenkonia alkaliphila]GFZ93602.1 carbonic anhydrase [Nesterenkonia alkaliphila]
MSHKQPTPAEAWQLLKEGNARFVTGEVRHPNQNAARRSSLTESQHPVAAIFGCSDSRLAAEIIFDVGLGDVFVVRTAGQVIDDAVMGSLEFSVNVLKVPLIVVLGHDSCGAVQATVTAAETGELPGGYVRDLVERIFPSVLAASRAGALSVNEMVEEHVKQTAERMTSHSRVLFDAVNEGRTAVVGVTYRLAEGTADVVSKIGELET